MSQTEVRFFKQISAISRNYFRQVSQVFEAKLLRWISVVSIIESDFNGGVCVLELSKTFPVSCLSTGISDGGFFKQIKRRFKQIS